MLSKDQKQVLSDTYEDIIKAFLKLKKDFDEDLKTCPDVSDPFLVFACNQLSICYDVLVGTYNFIADMEERLTLLSKSAD